jgi:hypothetical protein
MNGFAENNDRETILKRNIETLLSRKSNEFSAAQAATPSDPVIEMQRENQRLHRLLGELLLKNQQLRTELAGRERNLQQNGETR